jgi:2,4-dienoyl-CoA reductase-like NADH-dependent reductase (Old Yellow Enzyme family)
MVTIHGGHGWLASIHVKALNFRSDKWATALKKPHAFSGRVAEAIRARWVRVSD